jgi:hypothetical protein
VGQKVPQQLDQTDQMDLKVLKDQGLGCFELGVRYKLSAWRKTASKDKTMQQRQII